MKRVPGTKPHLDKEVGMTLYKVIYAAVIFVLSTLFLSAVNTTALAIPLAPDLIINGDIFLDTIDSFADPSVIQTGSIYAREGGGDTTTTYNGVTPSGANPLLGTLTDTGDGFGTTASVTAIGEFELYIDNSFSIHNSSLTDTYAVTLNVFGSNFVNADGTDAFATSEYTMDVDTNEEFFTYLVSDILFGDEFGDTGATGTFGDPQSDTFDFDFVINLLPGVTANIEGFLAAEGGVFDSVSSAQLDFDSFLSVESFENLTTTTPNTPIPEPSTILLVGMGLIGLTFGGRRRMKS